MSLPVMSMLLSPSHFGLDFPPDGSGKSMLLSASHFGLSKDMSCEAQVAHYI